jgi:hypothetical protein
MKQQEELGIDLAAEKGGGNPPVAVNFGRAWFILFVSLLLAAVMLAAPVSSRAEISIGVSVSFGPPAIPVYVQPPCPDPDYIWVPGYWAWDPDYGYYWVPGMWVFAPFPGALWTPGYWGWSEDGMYIWHEGYWGPVVGFYGGVNYGYGYGGRGYEGGYWSGGRFYYNSTVNNVNVTNITNVYSRSVTNVRPAGASFNGGPGGTTVRPTSEELSAARQRRVTLTGAQKQQVRVARTDPNQRASVNRGRPAVAATMKPGVFTGHGVVGASRAGAAYKEPQGRTAAPGERVRTRQGAEMRQPERMERGTPRNEQERRFNEPRPAMRQQERMAPGTPREGPGPRYNEPRPAPRRPEAARPQPEPKKEPRGEKKEEER